MTTIPRLNESLIRIRNLDEFAPFRSWLAAELKSEFDQLAAAVDDRTMRQVQGAVRKLEQLTKLIEESPRALEKSRV